jgi:hypothetical protein
MRSLRLALVLGLACGCGTTSTPGGDASVDASVDAPGDSASSTDSGTGTDAGAEAGDAGCGTACRLFSVYCNTAPCTCVSLASTEPDPTCDAGTVSCVVDPCSNKTAVCTANGCAVQ